VSARASATSAAPNATIAANAAAKPTAPAPLEVPAKPVTGQDLQALVQNISEGASLRGVPRDGERIDVRFHCTDSVQIASTIKSLSAASAFTDIQYHGTIAQSEHESHPCDNSGLRRTNFLAREIE
jgi:hypothetical protein